MVKHLEVISIFIIITLLVASLSTAEFPQKIPEILNQNSNPICIVGAGISGLSLGNLLKDKGYNNVLIFEQNSHIGGKVNTFYDNSNSIQIERGPILFSNDSNYLLNLIRKYDLNPIRYNSKDQVGFDPNSGSIQTFPNLSDEEISKLQTASQQFLRIRSNYKNDFDFEYLTTSPELFVPFSKWLEVRNLSVLAPRFILPITVEGYGHLDDVPALYVLKFIDQGEFNSLVSASDPLFILKEGLSAVTRNLAQNLNVKLSHRAISLRRIRNDLQEVQFNVRNGYKNTSNLMTMIQQCQKTILAFPPLLSNLKSFILDLSLNESEVLKEVKVHKYTSGGHYIPYLDHHIYYAGLHHPNPKVGIPQLASPRGRCEVVGLAKQSTKTLQNVYSSYSWIRGDYAEQANEDDLFKIKRQLSNFLSKISTNPKTFFLDTTEYFPHVTTESLKNGFYRKFSRDVQAKGGLYYATTLLSFETLDKAIEMTHDFVHRYF